MGFLTSIVEEAITKKGTLGQLGFITPSPPLFITISGAATVATFVGLAVTFYNATSGKMTARQVVVYTVRFLNFFGQAGRRSRRYLHWYH